MDPLVFEPFCLLLQEKEPLLEHPGWDVGRIEEPTRNYIFGCGSKKCTQKTLVGKRKNLQNLRSCLGFSFRPAAIWSQRRWALKRDWNGPPLRALPSTTTSSRGHLCTTAAELKEEGPVTPSAQCFEVSYGGSNVGVVQNLP